MFERVYTSPEVKITGPLGGPLRPKFHSPCLQTRNDDNNNDVNTKMRSLNKTESDTGVADANAGISFACDVTHQVIVIEMAEASGLPRIDNPL